MGNTGPPTNREAWSHSFARNSLRAVLAVKGSLRRKKRALDRSGPLRRPLRYEGMGDLRNGRTSCGGADEPWLPTKNPEEPLFYLDCVFVSLRGVGKLWADRQQ